MRVNSEAVRRRPWLSKGWGSRRLHRHATVVFVAVCLPAVPAGLIAWAGDGVTAVPGVDAKLAACRDAAVRGDYRAASDAATAAATAAAAAGDVQGRVAAAQHLGAVLQATGHYAESAARYEEAIALGRGTADARTSAALNGGLAVTLGCRQQFGPAAAALDRALAAAADAGDARLAAGLLVARGDLASSRVAADRGLARFADDPARAAADADELQLTAFAAYDKAAAAAAAAGDKQAEARALANAAVSALRAVRDAGGRPGDPAAGRADSSRADAVAAAAARADAAAAAAEALPDDAVGKARLMTVAGRLSQDLAALAPARRGPAVARSAAALNKAAALYRAAGDARGESYAVGYLGSLYERHAADRPADALALTRRAAFLAQAARSPQSLYRWEWQRGRLLAAAGNRDEAVAAYARAAEALREVRSDLALGYGNADGRLSFRDEVGPVYFGLADLLLRRAADPARPPALRQADLAEARETVEALKGGELEDYFRDPCVSQTRSLRPIDDAGPRTAVLYVVPLPDRLELLVSFSAAGRPAAAGPPVAGPAGAGEAGAGLRQFTLPGVTDARLGEVAARLRQGLQRRGSYEFRDDAAQLYDWLIRPIEPALREHGVDTLVLVPDGALRTVPLAALHDGERYLVERYAVAVSPGLRLMRPEPTRRDAVRVLTAGLSERRQGYPGLPNVERELAEVGLAFPGSVSLLNDRFVAGRLGRELYGSPFTVVHIASHGEFRGDAARTFVLAYDGKIDLGGLQALIAPAEYQPGRGGRPVDLLTLSACRTATGDDRAALGLAGVAVKAGARSAVASLWCVRDEAAAGLVGGFYDELRRDPGQSKAQAMRRAQLRLLADPSRAFVHPVYWAPFLVIGNWL
jgi:CHAT domain-containing protein